MVEETKKNTLPLEVLEVARKLTQDILIESKKLFSGNQSYVTISTEDTGILRKITILGKKEIDKSFFYKDKGLDLVIRIEERDKKTKGNFDTEWSFLFYHILSDGEYVMCQTRDKNRGNNVQLIDEHEVRRNELDWLLFQIEGLKKGHDSSKSVAVQN